MICGFCSVEQPVAEGACKSCGGKPTSKTAGKTHWEG
jgi:hypothetical protein